MSQANHYFHQPLAFERGAVRAEGQQQLVVSADYPYYRDKREHWADRLARLKALGIYLITAYIPWRHHQLTPLAQPDFTGHTQPNRDVVGFLQICQDLQLGIVVKPGPFIHAETNYGSLPDWVCPINNPAIEPLLDAEGRAVRWSGARLNASGTAPEPWPLPAPFSPTFLEFVEGWMAFVRASILQPFTSPAGPIVAVQIANEGIYSNGQHAPWAYDYSASGLRRYQEFLCENYRTLENYNRLNSAAFQRWSEIAAPRQHQRPGLTRAYEDWGAFQAQYMRDVFGEWSRGLATSLPILVNQNPPLGNDFGLDAWLTRVEPERWPSVHYGFTNWVGDVSANPSAFDRYLLMAKRFPGINWEENWGFAELYDPAYVDAATSFYQTLALLNAGATGFNVYTGVATAHVDRNLEVAPKTPYPDAAPITETGALTPKAEIVRWLALFAQKYGAEFLACRPSQSVAWGVYLPQARADVWATEGAPTHGLHLQNFQRQMRALHLDYGVLNLEAATTTDYLAYPHLLMVGGPSLSRAVQNKLAVYIKGGGQLAVIGALPTLDENQEPFDLLRRLGTAITIFESLDLTRWLAQAERPRVLNGTADVWVRTHPQRDVQFVTVLIPAGGAPSVTLEWDSAARTHRLELSAAPSGGALLRLEQGRLTDAIIKGHNGYLRQSVAPHCLLDGAWLGHTAPGDYARLGDWTAFLPAAVEGGD